METRPLSDKEVERLSEKAEQLAHRMKKHNPTQASWVALSWLEEAVRQKEIQRSRIGGICRVLKSFDVL